jgi:hypothetical protein
MPNSKFKPTREEGAETRKTAGDRSGEEMKKEVEQRQPAKGAAKVGETKKHELPGQGSLDRRDSNAMSQNGARVADFEDRPSR